MKCFRHGIVLAASLASLLSTLGASSGPPTTNAPPWDTFSDTWVATDGLGRTLPSPKSAALPGRIAPSASSISSGWRARTRFTTFPNCWLPTLPTPLSGQNTPFIFGGSPSSATTAATTPGLSANTRKCWRMPAWMWWCLTSPTVSPTTRMFSPSAGSYSEMRRPGLAHPANRLPRSLRRRTALSRHLEPELLRQESPPGPLVSLEGEAADAGLAGGVEPLGHQFLHLARILGLDRRERLVRDGRDKWPWLDHSPQNFGWHETPGKAEQISVTVAQHPTSNIGRSSPNEGSAAAGQDRPGAGHLFLPSNGPAHWRSGLNSRSSPVGTSGLPSDS